MSGSFTKGWNFCVNGWKTGNTIFFEALGYRDTYSGRSTGTGEIADVGQIGGYFSAGRYTNSYGHGLYFASSGLYPQAWLVRSYGFTIRPAKE